MDIRFLWPYGPVRPAPFFSSSILDLNAEKFNIVANAGAAPLIAIYMDYGFPGWDKSVWEGS
jgi:hypothetical protein